MALDSSRPIDSVMTAYFDTHVEPTLVSAKIPQDKQDAMRNEVKVMVTAIIEAVINEIVANGETVVTADVESIVSAIKGGTPIPQDGGAGLQSTIVSSLPTSISGKIK